jgi:quinol monooxygenase YgiN
MAVEKLTVVARCKAKPGREEEVEREILALVEPTRAEAGCINYDLHRSLDDGSVFMLYENWVSQQALDEHLATPYLQRFLGKAEEILAEPVDIARWKMITQPGR